MSKAEPEPHFNEEIHAPMRLRICAALAEVKAMEFALLRERLNVADSVLSKHAARLEAAGYLSIKKESQKGHLYTWVALTPAGLDAYKAHIAALRQLAGL
ncbi:MAG: transcriptional regulator [Bifidobacteriaceae bacterium]|jgi:DNA-binding MarR family transcriptional regulator|nr:transcriptional regulator [Bifidobacteriaceae bacterium]